jgi:4-hydroxyphenylpyruvate dioxygenase
VQAAAPHPNFNQQAAVAFTAKHGLAVRAVAVEVADAAAAYEACIAGGGISVTPPHTTADSDSCTEQTLAEVLLYKGGDVVLRFVICTFFTDTSSIF